MARPFNFIPLEDIKGLKTLTQEGKTQEEIQEYYKKHGIHASQPTISRMIKRHKL